jgi:hypothetical protein
VTVDFVIAATPSGARAAKDGSPTISRVSTSSFSTN